MSTDTATLTPASESVPQGRWRIDPTRSSVAFDAQTLWGRATVHGRFARYQGTLDLQPEPVIELTIDAPASTRTSACATGTCARRPSSTWPSTRR